MSASINDIWAAVPEVECQGFCEVDCRDLFMTPVELGKMRRRIRGFPNGGDMVRAHQRKGDSYRCPALEHGRCTAHDIRPLACRLYGASESVPCRWGCRVKGSPLSREETSMLWDAMTQIGGRVL